MSEPDPSGFIIAIVISCFLYRLFPRAFRCFFIGLGLSLWRTSPASYKDMIQSCSMYGQWVECKGDVSLLGIEIMVYTIAVMCAIAEVEGVIGRARLRSEKAA
jgi:hypothetical protein